MNFDISLDQDNVEKLFQTSLDLDITVGELINSIIYQWFADCETYEPEEEEPDAVDEFFYDKVDERIRKGLVNAFDGSPDPWDESQVDLDMYTKEEVKKLHEILGDDLFN